MFPRWLYLDLSASDKTLNRTGTMVGRCFTTWQGVGVSSLNCDSGDWGDFGDCYPLSQLPFNMYLVSFLNKLHSRVSGSSY